MGSEVKYWLVCVLAAGGGKESVFTYQSNQPLKIGSLVSINFKGKTSLGVVIGASAKPSFATKPLITTYGMQIPAHLVNLASWLAEHYVTSLSRVFTTMLPAKLEAKTRQNFAEAQKPVKPVKMTSLQAQQQTAVNSIVKGRQSSYLIHGATGSGKTRVYTELASIALKNGKSTIVLVPEISLTPQITKTFRQAFGSSVILTHSGMSLAERRFWWLQALNSKKPMVAIGPRSALFMPVPKLGFIVIDECHETTYKQEQSPRYNALNVAAKLASITSAKLVLGSATPAASDIYLAGKQKLKLIPMPKPVYKNVTKPTQLINLGDKSLLVRSRFLSEPLLDAIANTLERQKQTIIFMNRRGSARTALCGNCDWVANCPNCQIPLTFHADLGQLLCHWCNYHATPPAVCPACKHADIHFLGGGTQRIEAELSSFFPAARIARLDRDSFNAKTMPQIYGQLVKGSIDILIGTQMITKGLDLPGVETIGIVLADTMLYMPDFTAAERTFQLLYQVRGRAGRREGTPSETIIQTYSPKHPAIAAVVSGNYKEFIAQQLKERRQLHYPPYVYLLKLECSRKSRASAQSSAGLLTKQLKKLPSVEVVGPAPAWQETYGGNYAWQVIVKSPHRQKLVEICKNLPSNWTFDLDPIDLL